MKKISKIDTKKSLSEKVYQRIKTKIIEGVLKEGNKITEQEITNYIGVSKTPVREALQRLIVEGFIIMNSNQRMTIKKIFIKDIEELYQLRMVLDELAVRLIAEKITKKEIEKFNKIILKMDYFADKDDILKYAENATKFHNLIMHISKNKQLQQIYNNLEEKSYRYRIKSLKVHGRIKSSLKEHKKIVEALSTGNKEQALQLSQEHINNVFKNILKVIN
jgi:DNA-binding GntR family transcriptional regulator